MANFTRHPLDAMQVGLQAYGFNGKPLIKLGLPKSRGEKVFKEIEMALRQFDFTTDNSITQFNLTDDQNIKELKTYNRLILVKSAIGYDFSNKYDDEIGNVDSAEQLITFLKDTIGTVSKTEKVIQAKNQLNEAHRRSDEEETFCRFHSRLSNLAKICNSNDNIQSYLIKDVFEKSINSNLKQYLRDHDKLNAEPLEQAQFLDKMQKFKKIVTVNEIDAAKNSAFQMELMTQIQNQNKAMAIQSQALTELTEKIAKMSTQNSTLEAEIFKLRATPKTENQTKSQPTKTFEPRPEWELNKWGKPFRCRKCGLLGHRDENCKGTHLTCRNCNQVGHIAPVCKMSKN